MEGEEEVGPLVQLGRLHFGVRAETSFAQPFQQRMAGRKKPFFVLLPTIVMLQTVFWPGIATFAYSSGASLEFRTSWI
jgi:hypothetical protein